MGRKLARNVYVGETFYRAGDEPPKEDAEQITNPVAWGDEPDPEPAPSAPSAPSTESAPAGKPAASKPAKKTTAKKSAAKKS